MLGWRLYVFTYLGFFRWNRDALFAHFLMVFNFFDLSKSPLIRACRSDEDREGSNVDRCSIRGLKSPVIEDWNSSPLHTNFGNSD